ncbi:hypothetical protein AMK59_6494, partial [Oryctes borbonicus]
ICCTYELYRNDKQYRRRKELETDANILWSKEHAAKILDKSTDSLAQNGKIPVKNGTLEKSNSTAPNAAVPEVPVAVEKPAQETLAPKRIDRKEKRISFRDSAAELDWDQPNEAAELLIKIHDISEEDEDDDDTTRKNRNKDITDSKEDCRSVAREECIININTPEDFEKAEEIIRRRSLYLKPVFLSENQRKFDNPVSYLGGPRLPARNRSSIESILSID